MPITYHYRLSMCGRQLADIFTESTAVMRVRRVHVVLTPCAVFVLWLTTIGLLSNALAVGGAFGVIAFAAECRDYNTTLFDAMLIYGCVAAVVSVLFLLVCIWSVRYMARSGQLDYCQPPCR